MVCNWLLIWYIVQFSLPPFIETGFIVFLPDNVDMLLDGKEKIEGFLIRETPTTLANPEVYEGLQKVSDVN